MQRGSIILKSNAYYAVYRLPSGKQKWQHCGSGVKGKKAAKQYLADVLGQLAREGHSYREPQNAHFDEFAEKFLEQNSYRYKPSTVAVYRNLINARLVPYFGHASMRRAVTVEGVTAFVNHLLAEGVSVPSINAALNVLSAICTWAVRVDVLPRNPARQVVRPEDPNGEFTREVLSPTQMQTVIEKTPRGWKRNLVTIAVHTALRAGELAALKGASVESNSSELVVSATTWRRKVRDTTKNKKTRRVPMSAACLAAVRDQLTNRTPNTQDLLFCGEQGAVLDMSEVGAEVLKPALRRAGIVLPPKQDGWMVFRHSTISYWCAEGMPPATIIEISGHNSVQTLYKYYLHGVKEDRRRVTALMDALSTEGQTAAKKSRTA